jgi:hypothetical protein
LRQRFRTSQQFIPDLERHLHGIGSCCPAWGTCWSIAKPGQALVRVGAARWRPGAISWPWSAARIRRPRRAARGSRG